MGEERIPNSLLYGELVVGKCNFGRLKLRFKDLCKRVLKSWNIKTDELLVNDRNSGQNLKRKGKLIL